MEQNSTESSIFEETGEVRNLKFGIFVGLAPLGLICNIILIYNLIMDRALRRNLHYNTFLSLLTVTFLTNVIEVPRIIHYLHHGKVIPQNYFNCLFWQWCDYLLFSSVNLMVFWISVQRYLLIFHGNTYRTRKGRLIFHFIPLILIFVYLIIFYTVAIFIYPCEEQFDYDKPLCGFPCYTNYANISLYDLMAHSLIPLCLGILLDVTLVIRAMYRKRIGFRQSRAQWRKHRKMIFQLLLITSLFSSCQLPFNGVVFLQLFIVLPDLLTYIQIVYFYYLFWFLTLLLPMACMICLTEVMKNIKDFFMKRFRRTNTVVAATMMPFTVRMVSKV